MADHSHIAEHLTGDTVAFVMEKLPDGTVDFGIIPANDEHTWAAEEALQQVLRGLTEFVREENGKAS